MKRTAKQIRLDTLAEVAEKDKMKAKVKAKKQQAEPYCCEDKYGDNLPQRFIHCFDCPKLSTTQEST